MPGPPPPPAISTSPDLDGCRVPIAVQPQSMDRVSSRGGIVDLPGSGLHMPPEVLGEAESPKKEEEPQQRKSSLAQVNRRARKRSQRAVLATHSQAAVAAAAQGISKHLVGESSMVTLLTFEGTEVLFATSHASILGVCSRTHYVFQTLHLASDAPVVSLTSNSLSGLLVVAHQDGIIQTYRPVPTGENTVSGRYLWKNSVNLDCKVFYQQDEVIRLADRRSAEPGFLVDISSSYDDKLLVAHKNQLAVFDTVLQMTSPRSRLLWTTVLPANVVTAKIAGDGQAIVAVLEEDQDQDGNYGARTFIHDLEDGSAIINTTEKATLERTTSIGIVFKQGPFLKHAAPVTRLSFRGLGRTTSSILDNQGNDLLMSYCESDSSVRIFNQNSWKQLMMWAVPPKSRVDWIRGSSAFSLGDLESEKKPKSSRANSRRPSVETEASGGINTGLRNSVSSGTPNTAAGAWIVEITFRGAFPALRLSRLSYIKRGNDDSQPAHFESVAAILPAGSIAANSVLDSDDMGISVQGIWPAWNPWLSEPTGNQATDSLTGSAMQFLGLSSVPPPQTPYFGDSYQGGTHSPPTELRITAAHGNAGQILIMEFPLWGDDDFGAMELGSPLRSVLSLSSTTGGISHNTEDAITCASMDYDSSRLCAQIDPGGRSISLLWRRQGSHCIYSPHFLTEDSIIPKSVLESAELPAPFLMEDKSAIPLPLALPPLRLPSGTNSVNKESLISIHWLPDGSFDGPPLLLALTRSCTLMVFEIPPPRSVQEPAMPNFDPFNVSSQGSVDDSYDGVSNSDEDENPPRQEYEVSVTPHPDFGLGLRLESPTDGLPAIAGSFKKHPLNGGMLPAEKTGMIVLGDEVLSVNGVSLEDMTFDDIIATVRHVGAEAGPGRPLVLRFRPAIRSRKNSAVLNESFKPLDNVPSADSDAAINRRHLMSASPNLRKRVHRKNQSDGASLASMLVGSFGEAQQEFGRVIAVIRNAFSSVAESDISSSFLVTPWGHGVGSPSPKQARGAAMVLCGTGTHITAKRLVLPRHADPENARLGELGSLDVSTTNDLSTPIRSIQPVPSAGEDRCFVVSDSNGQVLLVVLEISQNDPTKADIQASFRTYRICTPKTDSNHFFIRPSSIDLFATYEEELEDRYRNIVTVWTARSDPSCRQIKTNGAVIDEHFGSDYVPQEIEVLSSASSIVKITDLSFVKSGYLDYFPSMIVFLRSEVIVYQRRSSKLRWAPVARIAFPTIPSSVSSVHNSSLANLTPQDAFPHMLPMIQAILPSFDETFNLVSDWHPEALIAYLCTDDRGAKIALHGHVQKTLVLLSDLAENASSFQNLLSAHSPLPVAPFKRICLSSSELDELQHNTSSTKNVSETSFVAVLSGQPQKPDIIRVKMDRLMDLLEEPSNFKAKVTSVVKSHEFQLAMAIKSRDGEGRDEKSLPPLLASFQPSEFRTLWAITDVVRNAPNYGNLDIQGQLALTIFAIHKSLKKSPRDYALKTSATSPYSSSNMHSFFQRRKSSGSILEKSKTPPQGASSGCVAALLSDYQGQLIDYIREPGQKLDWETVRELRIPFWMRSDDKLRQIAEEVGQSSYRESRDILKAAIFFIAAGKLRTLRNLAAADSTESGKKFFKFLTSYDFSTQRGRSAAEKNAFSLLRKNKYDCAAAFFLLAEPPMLKSAIETVASKMEDLDLAFMLSRLIGKSGGNGSLGFGSSPAFAFGGVLGGGGGYAGASMSHLSEGQIDNTTFDQWIPDISHEAKDLLSQRALPNAKDDNAFSALVLVWLSRQEEAWHWLSGFIECPDGMFTQFSMDVNAVRIHEATVAAKKSQDPTITMVNTFLNFTSGPLLLKVMKAATRTRVASAMLVSSSLCKIGIELPALRYLMQNGMKDATENDNGRCLDATPKAKPSSDCVTTVASTSPSLNVAKTTPSIFDEFDVQPPKKTTTNGLETMQSSIFDSFDAPIQSSKTIATSRHFDNGGMTSSIFSGFEAPPKAKPQPTYQPDEMTSSIFDSFDISRPTTKETSAPQSGAMESSIFDSFEYVPRATPSSNASQSISNSGIQSSIFDSFDSPSISKVKGVSIPTSFETKAESAAPMEPMRTLPKVWQELQKYFSLRFLGRRVLRELATIGSRFHIDIFKPAISPSGRWSSHCLPSNTSQVLQVHADSDEILRDIRVCLRLLSDEFGYSVAMIANEAISILSSPYYPQRVCFVVLLHLAMNQSDLAEDVVRRTSQSLMERCNTLAFVNDEIVFNRQSMRGLSLLLLKQTAAHLSWQLEVCLWLHRGGGLVLSALALNEAICAARIGLLIASWNRDFQVLEAIIKQPPDCLMDNRGGRQLWTSLKIISNPPALEKKASGVGSGGWEFLVDCRRAEATEMLRLRPTGCFIIRPHPDDHGVFTLSFKTNLKPTVAADDQGGQHDNRETTDEGGTKQGKHTSAKSVRRDDVVQHAIVRLSDSGFRCGSFGPFATLMKLLEAVSSSLPFDLRFDMPPTEGVIKEEGSKPSPNCALFRKLSLVDSRRQLAGPMVEEIDGTDETSISRGLSEVSGPLTSDKSSANSDIKALENAGRQKQFGLFLELLVLSEVRKQLSSVAAAKYDGNACNEDSDVDDSVGSAADDLDEVGPEQEYVIAARTLRPLLTWCRMMEIGVMLQLAPQLDDGFPANKHLPVALNASETGIEISTGAVSTCDAGGDAVIRRMIKPGSGVEFRTLRLGEGGESAMVVLFSKNEAVNWFLNNGVEISEEDALKRLEIMEKNRVIEPVDLKLLTPRSQKKSKPGQTVEFDSSASQVYGKGVRYRLVDPWEVEPLESREAETRGASLGRHRFLAFGLGRVAASCEDVFRSLGGFHLLELWGAANGGVALTKAIATVHPPWERGSGGDLQLNNGNVAEPVAFDNSIRQHIYRNSLFRRLALPQRFMALIQVELLDLKNLTSPGGSLSLTVYALLRVKRPRSTAPLTTKARTLDSVATHPAKLGKAIGPNAPASWGSLVRFRFPLPENTGHDGRSYDGDREALFKGPPSVLQVSVYEKKFMSDTLLGGADVTLEGLSSGGQLEEWVPLRTETHGINWFARIRLTLRFELMCLSDSPQEGVDNLAPSFGLKRIHQLCSSGGMQEDVRRSVSTPDLLSYFESMVY